eukprot:CAMPEP_0206060248 /NCGR_PEP_ID=MMETSP1466-20131121/50730_1 /ASSEMBLY_ACC=CAM_ASM_001126 /TAXON_ID=44452 /ORGANISM="Pavlova gyrans, Strain CCMP608" /LENGTH=49 /DNA_ID= /DNA_START= /DNA_END= /DNA_ORIENTATION=
MIQQSSAVACLLTSSTVTPPASPVPSTTALEPVADALRVFLSGLPLEGP